MRLILTALLLLIIILVALTLFQKPSGEKEQDNSQGKLLYLKCQPCHRLFEEYVGPPMYGTLERVPDKEWIHQFINNPSKTIQEDAYASCLKNKYKSVMTAFIISKKEIDTLYTYVYSEARKRKDIWQNPKFFTRCK